MYHPLLRRIAFALEFSFWWALGWLLSIVLQAGLTLL